MMILRKPRKKDLPALETLFQETRRHTFSGRNPETFKMGDYAQSTQEDEVWISEEREVITGFVSIYPPHNFIHNLFVHPDHQGKGLGKALLQVAEENLSRPMTLKVAMDNPKVLPFYEKYGWRCLSLHPKAENPHLLLGKN